MELEVVVLKARVHCLIVGVFRVILFEEYFLFFHCIALSVGLLAFKFGTHALKRLLDGCFESLRFQ